MASMTLPPPDQLATSDARTEQSIADEILSRLGKPDGLCRIDVKHLWDNKFRVNVYCAADAEDRPLQAMRITDSFHVAVTEDGLNTHPEIEKKY